MISRKGMDELFLRYKEFENIHDWVEGLEITIEVRGIDELKLLKIGKLNLKGKSKEWFKKLTTIPIDWQTMKGAMLLKYGKVDLKRKS
jgi:hypothetical protein